MDSIRSGPMDSSGILPEQELQDVFLSHAGKQKPFVRDVYNDLLKWPRHPKIKPFFDQDEESLPKGAEFPARIFEAARRCTVAVLFLTTEFVTSKWPMLELITFVEARETTNPGLNLLPVFYDGEPTSEFDDNWIAAWKELEAESGSRHSPGRTRISVELCKHALRQLRKVNGLVLNNNMGLQSLRESILHNVLKLLPPSSELDTTNVQGCLRLCKSIENMFEKDGRGVFCLGLYGVGGLGKTTLCRELCNYFGPSLFNRCCHLEIDSKDTDEDSSRLKRYIKILEAYSYLSKEQISNLNPCEAKKCVQQCLSEKKEKFLAVDNVQVGLDFGNEAQNYLDWLSPGSIIIITSRSRDVLLGVKPGMLCRPIPNLEREEAMTLFLRNAAPHVAPQQLPQHQIRILDECLKICFFSHRDSHGDFGQGGHYHPLALLAVASYLRERCAGRDSSILCWEKVLKDKNIMFSHSPNARDHIYKVLGLGFTDLCDVSKQLFIDVALFASSSVAEDIFNWLVFINHECAPELLQTS